MTSGSLKYQITKGELKKGKNNSTSTSGSATPPPKISSTTPYSIFVYSVERSKNLLLLHTSAHGAASRPPLQLADTHRAAIVLAVSALDAFVRTLVVEKIIAIINDQSREVPKKLEEKIKEYLGIDGLFEAVRKNDLSSRIQCSFSEKFEAQSFQGVNNISKAMELTGHKNVFNTIATAASVNEENLKSNLAKFTQRRHLIAHCGDYDLNQTPPTENSITKQYVKECIRTVELIAREINKLK